MAATSFTLRELLELLGDSSECEDRELTGFSPASAVMPGTVTWVRLAPEDWSQLSGAVVIAPSGASGEPADVVVVRVENPRLAFARALERFGGREQRVGVEPTAVIGEGCEIGDDVYIGHYTVIGAGSSIGAGTSIGDHVSVLAGCKIGSGCTIASGVVIGTDGFGYERDESGEWVKFPHVGNVVIEDNVEIGANTCIDRGGLGDTLIKRGAKIDNLCHIAHNVVVGERAMVIALSMIGGSTILEEDSYIAPAAAVINKATVGRGATVGLGAVVVKDVPPDTVVMGVPARPRD